MSNLNIIPILTKIRKYKLSIFQILYLCAYSRCNSFEEASLLLEELRPFDNQVYGVAHGLLMGQDEYTWSQALSLFDDMKRMDSSTASGFYNALTDMLWHFGQVTYFFREILSLLGEMYNVTSNCVFCQYYYC